MINFENSVSRSQSKTSCPLCDRPPGGVHNDFCPRSRVMQRDLDAQLEIAGRPLVFWAKGPIAIRRGWRKKIKIIHNPGVPYVKPPKPWYAGGKPRDAEALEIFLKHMGVTT
jgi:hypothetical protein